MADKRFQHGQNPVGAGHASLEDNLNRLKLAGGMIEDGTRNYLLLNQQSSAPGTAAAQDGLYLKSDGLYYRKASNGAEVKLAA